LPRRVSRSAGALTAIAAASAICATAANAQTTATVSVNAGTPLGTIPTIAFGVNTPVWGSLIIASPTIEGDVNQLGANIVRYPGGTVSDMFHWANDTVTTTNPANVYLGPFNTYAAPAMSFANFMTMIGKTSAQPMITVNYGTDIAGTGPGDPTEAAAWVTYANVTNKYAIKYWEIGNEVYGNGEYGAATTSGGATTYTGNYWEPDLHSLLLPPNPMGTSSSATNIERAGLPALGPTAYGTNALTYISDMKAADPTIKVGVVLTAPGFWPDASAPGNPSPAWNPGVLQACGSKIDFVVVHWYPENPGFETDAGLLSSTTAIANMVATLKQEITQYCGTNAPNVQIFVTETNSVSSTPGKQSVSLVSGLFLPDNIMSWLEAGAQNVDWWSLFNSLDEPYGVTNDLEGNMSSSLYGASLFGDYGLLSSGTAPEPAADTPFPSYYGYAMIPYLGHPGDTMVSSSTSSTLVASHAVQQANGNLAVLLINKDPANTNTVNVSVAGYEPAQSAMEYTYGEGSTAITSSTLTNAGPSFATTIAPYSLNTIVMTPAPAPVITATTTLPYNQVAVGTGMGLSTTITDTGGPLTNAYVMIDVFNSTGTLVAQYNTSGVNLAGYGASTTLDPVTTPTALGSYNVGVVVMDSTHTKFYFANGAVASFSVGYATVYASANQDGTSTFGEIPIVTPSGTTTEPGYTYQDNLFVEPGANPITALNATMTISAPNSGTVGGISETYPASGFTLTNAPALTYTCVMKPTTTIPASFRFSWTAFYNVADTLTHMFSADTYSVTYTCNGQTFTVTGVY
jgi:hypothetical protein